MLARMLVLILLLDVLVQAYLLELLCRSVPVLRPPAVSPCGQRDSDQTADVDGEFCETDRLHAVLETKAASSLVA